MKERLTDAALDLIWHNSYGTTSVDAICERAGAKKGSFYYFFKSKSELTAAALEAEVNSYLAELAHACDEAGRRLVVRNGYHVERTMATAGGRGPWACWPGTWAGSRRQHCSGNERR